MLMYTAIIVTAFMLVTPSTAIPVASRSSKLQPTAHRQLHAQMRNILESTSTCSSDSDCAAGEFCLFKLCTITDSSVMPTRSKDGCSSDADCATAEFCLFEMCTIIDSNVMPARAIDGGESSYPGCQGNADCPYNEFCSAFGLCIADTATDIYPGCTANIDCLSTETCFFGACVTGLNSNNLHGCSTNSDCSANEFCGPFGLCLREQPAVKDAETVSHTDERTYPACHEHADCKADEICNSMSQCSAIIAGDHKMVGYTIDALVYPNCASNADCRIGEFCDESESVSRKCKVFAADTSGQKTKQQNNGPGVETHDVNRMDPAGLIPAYPALNSMKQCITDSNCPSGQYCASTDLDLFGVPAKLSRCVRAYARSKPIPPKIEQEGSHLFLAATEGFSWKVGMFPPCPDVCGAPASVVAQTLACHSDDVPAITVSKLYCQGDTTPSLLWKTCPSIPPCDKDPAQH
jgi:hypothetical protein